MGNFFEELLQEFGLFEWLLVWLFLLGVPIGVFASAIRAVRERGIRKGGGRLSIGVVLIALLGWLLISSGKRMVELTIASVGGWVIGLLVAGVLCAIAFPMSLAGSQLRAAFEYSRKGYWIGHGRKSLLIGMTGVVVIIGIAFAIHRLGDISLVLAFDGVAALALVVGWFGQFLVPEILPGDPREPLEAPEVIGGRTPSQRASERIEAAALLIHPDTIKKYVPQALSYDSDGNIVVDFRIVLSRLFRLSISDEIGERLMKSGKMSALFLTAPAEFSRESAARAAVAELQKEGLSPEILPKSHVYSIASRGTETNLTAYLVIVGNLPELPM